MSHVVDRLPIEKEALAVGGPIRLFPAGDDTRLSAALTAALGVRGVVENWLIGKGENAQNFAVRYYEVDVGGFSHAEQHPHDHGVIILRGKARAILWDEEFDVEPYDVVYIEPDHFHQLINIGDEPMGFLCIIPALEKSK